MRVAQTSAPAAPEPKAAVPASAAAAVDQLLVGNQELQKEQYGDAEKFFADFLRKNPERMDAKLCLGSAEFGLKKYDEAEKTYKEIIDKYPTAWPALKWLSEVYSAEGKWTEFDAVRKLLHDAKEKNEAFTYSIGNDVIDLLYVDNERYIVREFYPLADRAHIRYLFLHVDKQGKADYWITCESEDPDQISFAKMHPDLAAQGKRSFSLDTHTAPVTQPNGMITRSQGLIKFYWDGEPTYETVRADVLGSLQHKVAPMAATTVNGTAPAAQQTPAPAK
jgi:tetratricopeptide (TPR) repeat protein